VDVFFPPGPATLVHVAVKDRLRQIVPANQDQDLNRDHVTVTSFLEYEILDPPYELIVEAWSPDAVYDHTITVDFDMEPAAGSTWRDMMRFMFGGGRA
jgi:hypothetical protein